VLRTGAELCDGEGPKLRDVEGATRMRGAGVLRGAGATWRGSTRVRVGALARGSTRLRLGASARGGLDDEGEGEDEDEGRLRTTSSRRNDSRALGETRGEELLRRRASEAAGARCREKSSAAMRRAERRIALGGGAVRTAGTALGGTRAADMAGPRGALAGATAAGRTPGAAATCREGAAGAW
jgi:hypothetical protein